eukprot:TRINITY_DN1546_c0_g4_i1.p1 TRINITY_DN1546_c0_g4~~TRINITY_DN1546_c0_g4_i1.p1  ORF type:complete len:449 (+),score=66.97 TRINITY_DN1546_c0_g4_i1:263-1609(+)
MNIHINRVETEENGIFKTQLNIDKQSNAYPRDFFFAAPLTSLIIHEQVATDRNMVVLDVGCGPGFLIRELIVSQISAFGIDSNTASLLNFPYFSIRADVTEPFSNVPLIVLMAGVLRRKDNGPLYRAGNQSWSLNVNAETFERPARPDWVVCIDVGSYIPDGDLRQIFMNNLVNYATRGFVMRWGAGPHQVETDLLVQQVEEVGFIRDKVAERTFALFSELLGPMDKGPVLVFVQSEVLPRGVYNLEVDDDTRQPYTINAVMAQALEKLDPFEPNKEAIHFSPGEDLWHEEEVEITASYARLWRACLHPKEAKEVLAPLRLKAPASRAHGAALAWGSISWHEIAESSWDFTEPLEWLLEQSPDAVKGLATQDHVEFLKARRGFQSASRATPIGASGSVRDILSRSSGNGLTAGASLAESLNANRKPGVPLGLHRQTWLHRLASRFISG